jgi:hypothetical protein
MAEIQRELSPDGHWLAYVSDQSQRNEVYLTTFPNRGTRWPIITAGRRFLPGGLSLKTHQWILEDLALANCRKAVPADGVLLLVDFDQPTSKSSRRCPPELRSSMQMKSRTAAATRTSA